MSKEIKKIKEIKNYFTQKQNVMFGFLFGSRIRNQARKASDWDIGVYLRPTSDIQEKRNKIWNDLEKILKTEVDLVLLNQAPPLLANRIICQGIAVAMKDRRAYLDFLIRTTEEAESMREFVHDYYKIYQRSASLSEQDKIDLERILIFLENELKDFSKFQNLTFDEYQKDISIKREVERWIENLMNSILDIAKILLASSKKTVPATYREIILALKTLPEFEPKTIEKITDWIRLRNILAHEYLDIRWDRISKFLQTSQPFLENFLCNSKKLIKYEQSRNKIQKRN